MLLCSTADRIDQSYRQNDLGLAMGVYVKRQRSWIEMEALSGEMVVIRNWHCHGYGGAVRKEKLEHDGCVDG